MGLKEPGLRGSLRNVSVGIDAIPDSAIHQWAFDEGSGSTATDSAGDNDLSISGASWVSNGFEGGFALDFDGTDDNATGSFISQLTGDNEFSFAFTVDLDNSSKGSEGTTEQVIYNADEDGSFENTFTCSVGNDSSDAFEFESRDSNGDIAFRSGIDVSGESGLARLTITHDGSGNSTVYLNGSEVTDQNLNGNVENDSGFAIASDSKNDLYWDGRMDHPIAYDSELSSSEVQNDYDTQPWS